MKKTALILSAGALLALNANAQLVLTGIIDGPLSGGTPKALELYALEDIPDLSIYGLEIVNNSGFSEGGVEAAFSGSLTAGSYYYIASESAQFEAVFGFAPDLETSIANHNGDDDFYIYKNGVVVDTWGGSDGVDNTGTEYDILDSWAYRLNNQGPSTAFSASEWTIAAPNSLDNLDASQVAATVPFGTYTAVPEPQTYAAIAGLMVLGLAVYRRRK